MVMVVSTPSGPFKTFCPSSFRFTTGPCRLLGWRTSMATSYPHASSSPQIFLRRDVHFHWCPNNSSFNTSNLSSSKRFQQRSSYFVRQHSTDFYRSDIVKRVNCFPPVSCLEPVVSDTQRSSTSSLPRAWPSDPSRFGYEVSKRISIDLRDWDRETQKLQQSKVKFKNSKHGLEEPCDTNNCSIGSTGSQTGSGYVAKNSSDQSLCSPSLMDIKRNGQSQPVCPSQFQTSHSTEPMFINGGSSGMDCAGKMSSSLKQNTTTEVQPYESNGRNLANSERFPPCKVGLKSNDSESCAENHKNLACIYNEVLVIDNISSAKKIVELLTTKYRNLVHACDTEVAKIDVKQETPVDHGEIICFSIYSGPKVDFGNGKSCIWVDVLDGGGKELLMEFAPFFEDSSIQKVWHNYSFDSHVIENYGIKISGFHADTMHMARLWDSARRTEGGYSLEALTRDSKVMNGAPTSDSKVKSESQSSAKRELIGKISMISIFGRKKLRRDGSEGKVITIAPVEELQREERTLWISYSALDSMSTLQLYESLQSKLEQMDWVVSTETVGTMYNFYERYWRPFGELLVKMETEGMLVDLAYLAEIQKVATREQQIATNRFRNWAARYCPDAVHMNVGSDAQLRQFLFGGTINNKDQNETLPLTRDFLVPNVEGLIGEGRKVPSKFRNITLSSLHNHGFKMETEMYTATGWPSVSGDALKTLAGKVSSEYDWIDEAHGFESERDNPLTCNISDVFTDQERKKDVDVSSYGIAYKAFGENKEGREACHAIAALCEVCSIDSLISNFILPLQSCNIAGKNGRIHCSLNINTETGRLSARRPNLQNQPALEKDRYKIRQAFVAAPGSSLIVADYGQLELRILAHLADCKSMKEAFEAGGDFHSRTAMNMYSHIREAVEKQEVLLEWHPQPGEDKPPVPLLKDAFASERRKAKMLNFSIAYGKTPVGLSRDWKVSVKEARATVDLWYKNRKEVLEWQKDRKREANEIRCVKTLLGRTRSFPSMDGASYAHKGHIERAAINTPVQGSAADVAMCAMLEISRNARLKELGWRLLLQVHDEVILEGPTESAELAKAIVVECMSKPFDGKNILSVDLAVDAKCAQNWYAAK